MVDQKISRPRALAEYTYRDLKLINVLLSWRAVSRGDHQ